MSDQSTHLNLPFIAEAQAQKHVTHNEAIRALDALVQLVVLDRDLSIPPVSPTEGDRYIIANGASGNWASHEQQIGAFQDGAWAFFAPKIGWLTWVADEEKLYTFDGAIWVDFSNNAHQNMPMLGINATADTANRLSINAPSTLLNHQGAGHQLKMNKNTSADTASVLFQSNWSGRAEFGTTGDDDWHVKVSADGSNWNEALIADRGTGAVRFPAGIEHALSRKPVSGLIFTSGGDGQVSIFRNDRVRSQDPRTAVILSVVGDVITLTSNDANLFFWSIMRDVSYIRIWNTSKSPVQSAWVKWDTAANQLQVTDSAHVAGWTNGETIQLGDIVGEPGVPVGFTRGYAIDISPMMQNMVGAVFPQSGLLVKVISFGVSARVGISFSANGTSGSYVGGNSLSDGSVNVTMHTVPCNELSPISNSNLLILREDGVGPDSLSISGVSVMGVYG